MGIHSLVKKLAEIEGAEVGRGPKHPTAPNLDLSPEIDSFLAEYDFISQDKGYVQFLESYAGAYVWQPANDLTIDFFGFAGISTHIVNEDGPIVDEQGFLVYCDGTVWIDSADPGEKAIGQSFAFDATGNRRWGIYRRFTRRGEEINFYWYCKTFEQLLEHLIKTKGQVSEVLSTDTG